MANVLLHLVVLAACSLGLVMSGEEHWAVLVAGSNTWMNYRHQADICHAYQILHKNGIPDERIIVFMYDDIANNEENPTPGVIINRPDGPDVYAGVPHDYTGEAVTPENFLAVLAGNSSLLRGGNGKVLRSDGDDHVFIYFADHGAPDLIAFPEGELYSKQLLPALQAMYDNQMYAKLVFYVEACESGSMFVDLPTDINIFATTAANPDESSYGYYCNITGMPCLGDEYSIHWMEDSDAEDLTTETLQDQYKTVKKETVESHVCEYGDMDFRKEALIDFQGGVQHTPVKKVPRGPRSDDPFFVVPSREIEMSKLHMALQGETNLDERDRLLRRISDVAQRQSTMIQTVKKIVSSLTRSKVKQDQYLTRPAQLTIKQKSCYQAAVSAFSERCFRLGQNEYATGLVYVFGNICNDGGIAVEQILQAIHKTCF